LKPAGRLGQWSSLAVIESRSVVKSEASEIAVACEHCGRVFRRTAYEIRSQDGTLFRCLRCALTQAPLVRRSAIIALVVGTILTAINQGNIILSDEFPPSLYWKIALTYAVPYCVATAGAILNARRSIDAAQARRFDREEKEVTMYGSVYKIRPKAGKEQDIVRMMEEWDRERRPNVKGALGGCMYKLDNGGLMGVAIFESKDDYRANAESPEQNAFYRRWRELMESDPEWNDGEIVGSWGQVP